MSNVLPNSWLNSANLITSSSRFPLKLKDVTARSDKLALALSHKRGGNIAMKTQEYPKSRYKQKIGGSERRFLRMPNANIVIGARIQGRVSHDLLKSAILKVRQKHPLLGVRIHLDNDATGWFIQEEDVPDIPIEIRPRTTSEDWIKIATEELGQTFSIETGPLIRIVLLQSSDVADLLITAHHSICDGRSLIYLIRDLMTYLAHPDETRSPLLVMPVSPQDCLPPSVGGGWIYKLIVRRINQK